MSVVEAFGFEGVEERALLKLVSRMIIRCDCAEDEELIALSSHVYRQGIYDEVILMYLMKFRFGPVDELLDIGVDQIVFHGETQPHIDGMLNRIHAKGVKAGVALKPATPLSELEYVLDKCDTVLLMLINPGYAFVKGEKQVTYADRKIRELRKMITDRGLKTKIEVDGRISPDNIRTYGKSDVDIFVTGSTCIKKDNMEQSLEDLMKLHDLVIGG